jgi:hypothetical protein
MATTTQDHLIKKALLDSAKEEKAQVVNSKRYR